MSDDLRDEYQFDYRRAKPNRFAAALKPEANSSPIHGEDQLKPSDIVEEVRAVLVAAHRGKGTEPTYLTAFQILDRLPPATRDRLIRERGAGGPGAGSFAAPSVVSRAARLAGAEVAYLDSVGLSVQVAGEAVTPTYEVCGVYRLHAGESSAAQSGIAG